MNRLNETKIQSAWGDDKNDVQGDDMMITVARSAGYILGTIFGTLTALMGKRPITFTI